MKTKSQLIDNGPVFDLQEVPANLAPVKQDTGDFNLESLSGPKDLVLAPTPVAPRTASVPEIPENTSGVPDLDLDAGFTFVEEVKPESTFFKKDPIPEIAEEEIFHLETVNAEAGTSEKVLRNTVTSLMDQGILTKMETLDIDGEAVPFDQIEVTQELLEDLVRAKLDESQSSPFTADDPNLSEFTRKLVEIEMNGGDASEAVAHYADVVAPLEQIDMTTPQGQAQVLALHLESTGLDSNTIQTVVTGLHKAGNLEEKAIEAFDLVKDSHVTKANELALKATEDAKNAKAAVAQTKTAVKTAAKSLFKLDAAATNKLANFIVPGKAGTIPVLEAVKDILGDPEQAAELAYFMMNKDDYKKAITADMAVQHNLETLQQLQARPILAGGTAAPEAPKFRAKKKATQTAAPTYSQRAQTGPKDIYFGG